ncbi:hypothetical protein KCP70_23270 [Salmonella enterica subsp. enterica]|nr:hypothetical protein KCP70_23270 [Salmonella enterica subsp. enterica]
MGKEKAHDIAPFYYRASNYLRRTWGYYCCQTLVSASSIVFSNLRTSGTHCIYVITQLLNFSAQRTSEDN